VTGVLLRFRGGFVSVAAVVVAACLALLGCAPPDRQLSGGDRFSFEPNREITAGAPVLWTVRYQVDADGVAAGGALIFRFPHPYYFMAPLNWTPRPSADGSLPATASARSGAPVEVRIGDRGWHPDPVEIDFPDGLPGGDELTLTVGEAGGGRPSLAPIYAVRGFAPLVLVDRQGTGKWERVPTSDALTVVAGPPVRLQLIVPSEGRTGQPVEVTVRLEDRFGNVARLVEPLELELQVAPPMPPGEPVRVRFAPGDEGWRRVAGPVMSEAGVARLTAAFKLSAVAVRSNPIRVSVGEPAVRTLWGDLHGHSQMSDGSGTAAEYYAAASGPGALDFAALSDHEWMLTGDEWQLTQQLCQDLDAPGELVPFLAWEYSLGGHRVVYHRQCMTTPATADFGGPKELWQVEYNHQPIHSWTRDPAGRVLEDFGDLAQILSRLDPDQTLVVPHTSATWHMGNDWDTHDPTLERLVEIHSAHGCDEARDCPGPVSVWVERGSVRSALRRGYRLGFIANGDSHDGHPGRTLSGSSPGGLTAVRAPRLEREALWGALSDRSVYATTGVRILLDFAVNREPMGGVSRAGGPPLVEIEVRGTDLVERVDLVSDRGVVHSFTPGSEDFSGSWSDPLCDGLGWYYARVVQRDGAVAWSSPVWVVSPGWPAIDDLRAVPEAQAITLHWRVRPPAAAGRLQVLRRRGNDGEGALDRYRPLATLVPEPGAMTFVDRDLPGAGITCYYALVWRPPSAAAAAAGPQPLLLGLVSAESRPDPAADRTALAVDYFLEEPGPTVIEIRNLMTRVVRRVELVHAEPGPHRYLWDGLDQEGRPCRGLHFFEVSAAGVTTPRKPLRMGGQ